MKLVIGLSYTATSTVGSSAAGAYLYGAFVAGSGSSKEVNLSKAALASRRFLRHRNLHSIVSRTRTR